MHCFLFAQSSVLALPKLSPNVGSQRQCCLEKSWTDATIYSTCSNMAPHLENVISRETSYTYLNCSQARGSWWLWKTSERSELTCRTMKDLSNINHCDQGTKLINENLSRSSCRRTARVGHDGLDSVACGENVGGGESKWFKWRQVEGWRENKVSAAAKGWHGEERAAGKRQATANWLQVTRAEKEKHWHLLQIQVCSKHTMVPEWHRQQCKDVQETRLLLRRHKNQNEEN